MLRKRLVLGELEVRILNVLWDRGEATVRDVLEGLPEDGERHYNTCSTVLNRLVKRGLVAREPVGRGFVYSPLIDRDELGRQYLETLSKDLFGGSLARTLATLLTPGKISGRQLKRIESMLEKIEQRERQE